MLLQKKFNDVENILNNKNSMKESLKNEELDELDFIINIVFN